jgi:hypothetical protein
MTMVNCFLVSFHSGRGARGLLLQLVGEHTCGASLAKMRVDIRQADLEDALPNVVM